MSVEEAKELLTPLANKHGKYTSGEKSSIEELYSLVLDKPFKKTSCNDCYHDGAIEALVYLRKYNKFRDLSSMEYILKSGAIIRFEVAGHVYTNNDLTTDVAERYIGMDLKNIKWFAKYPENWQERVEARLREKEQPTETVKRTRRKKTNA